MVRAGDGKARLALRATGKVGSMLSASQLGITLSSLGLGWIAERTVGSVMRNVFAGMPASVEMPIRVAAGATVALLLIAYLHVVIGELVPRATALNNPEQV